MAFDISRSVSAICGFIADNPLMRIISDPTTCPVIYTIGRGKVVCFSRRPGIEEDMIQVTGIPETRVLQVGDALWTDRFTSSTSEQVVFAVGSIDDLAVPIAILLDGGVF